MAIGLLLLNDVAVTLLSGRTVIASSPGVITRTDEGLVIGEDALKLARLYPTDTSSDFWYRLGLERATSHGHTHADLAFAHLEHLWNRTEGNLDGLVLVVPSSMSREQLGLLLGMATKLEIPVRGLLDGSVFCGARPAPGRKLIHLQLHRHQLLSTELHQGARLSVERRHSEPYLGLMRLQESWAEAVADAFVRKTRFDPMHSAETEQQIYEGIEALVGRLGSEMAVEVTLEKDGEARTADVRRDALLSATAERYKRLVEALETQRDGAALALAVDQSLAALPGLTDLLGAMPDTELQIVSPENVRHTVVDTRQSWVTSDNSQLRLVQDIPWSADAASTPVATVSSGTGDVPSHVLFDGVAHPVGTTAMVVGLEPGTATGPQLERRYPGVSRQHFRVQRKDKELWIEDLSRYGTLVNGEKIAGTRQLRVGDEIRIGNPAASFQVIRVAGDGA